MRVLILGTRGVPARHGGFETFAEQFSTYLVTRGHEVTVYCQADGATEMHEDDWQGVHRVHIPAKYQGAKGTMEFDLASVRHASKQNAIVLTLGYNTAIFSMFYGRATIAHLMNMDGVEWQREKWSFLEKVWLWLNEFAGAKLSTHLIADHPEIARHLQRHTSKTKITTIPYASERIDAAPLGPIQQLGLEAGQYAIVVARPEPENSIVEIVRAFSARPRDLKLVMLGKYTPETNRYHKRVLDCAGEQVLFPGAIYDKEIVQSLRFHAAMYVHGHTVGGTNPSLVEALGAGNAIVAHDNIFNRWVAGPSARYFSNWTELSQIFDHLVKGSSNLLEMQLASRVRHQEAFTVPGVMACYENLLQKFNSR